MTQLNLSGQSNTTQQKPTSELEDGSIKNQTVGALGALAMFAAVIVIGSCSRSTKPVAVQQPVQPTTPVSTQAPVVVPPAPAPAPVVAKAKTKKRRAAMLSYVNRQYGVGFSFPRQYSLKSGDEAQLSWKDLGPFQMDFVHPGGITLAAVELPGNSYPGTDFRSAFVNLSVNPGMTSEACTQFASLENNAPADPPSTQRQTIAKVANVKIGGIDFSKVENSTAATTKLQQTDARYYHTFSNGACYEFALGIGTEGDGNVEGVTPVDREQVFGKLEKILATVELQPVVVPETETPLPSAGVTDNSTTTQQNAIDRRF
jgi:hypothetical protein